MGMSQIFDASIEIEQLVQIYGNAPHQALELLRVGRSRDHIYQSTNNLIGVNNISLKINAGELFVIMGLSGSGKSTLIRCINRLIQPISGHIHINGQDIVHLAPDLMRQMRAQHISMVFQQFSLFPHRTVLENTGYGLMIQGYTKEQWQPQAMDMLERVGLANRANTLPSTLSGGMQQRVGLARALATGAEILLMDEPFSAIDPMLRRDMQAELQNLQSQFQKTILFISHDVHEAFKIGDRVAVMRAGEIVQVGTPRDLLLHPVDDYIQAFTQDVNRERVLSSEKKSE